MTSENELFDESNINEHVYDLMNAWRTESDCPEILPFKTDLIDEIKASLEQQQMIVDIAIENENKKEGEYFTATLYQMDLDRIRYSLVKYFRTRIMKIEEAVDYILSNVEVMDRLSKEEKIFVSKLYQLNNFLLEDVVLSRVSEEIRGLFETSEDRLKHCQPDYQKFVFCLPMEDIQAVELGEGEYVGLENKKVALLPYKAIRQYVMNGKAILL